MSGKVKLNPKNPKFHADDCPCNFCEETRQAFERSTQKFIKANEEQKKKKK